MQCPPDSFLASHLRTPATRLRFTLRYPHLFKGTPPQAPPPAASLLLHPSTETTDYLVPPPPPFAHPIPTHSTSFKPPSFPLSTHPPTHRTVYKAEKAAQDGLAPTDYRTRAAAVLSGKGHGGEIHVPPTCPPPQELYPLTYVPGPKALEGYTEEGPVEDSLLLLE